MSQPRYRVPATTHRVDAEIRHSRFITTVARAATIEEAEAFIRQVGAEFPDASHNCWAYLVGAPGSSSHVGMSDAGEPHGTAGRPMLAALQHGGIGDVVAVVTRYYGGTRLGTGGLVRAYTSGVQRALETLPTTERIEWARLAIVAEYSRVSVLQQLFPAFEAEIVGERYEAEVRFEVRVPAERLDALRGAVLDATRGQAAIEEV